MNAGRTALESKFGATIDASTYVESIPEGEHAFAQKDIGSTFLKGTPVPSKEGLSLFCHAADAARLVGPYKRGILPCQDHLVLSVSTTHARALDLPGGGHRRC
jgi:hypothetical protein